MQQHQGQQCQPFRIFGVDRTQHASEADGFGAQLPPDQRITGCRGVALVEDQINDGLDRGPPFGQGVVRRHLVGDAGVLDLAFGAHQPLRQGRLRNEKGARDLARRKPAERAQGQGDLGLAVQGGMATGENQAQPIIRNFARQRLRQRGILGRLDCDFMLQQSLFLAPRAFAPLCVDQFAVGRGRDPCGRIVRHAALGPMTQRRRERLLHRLLGAVEGAAQPDQAGDDPAVLAPKYRFCRGANFTRGRH